MFMRTLANRQLLNVSCIKTGTKSQLVGTTHEYDSAAFADGVINASDIPIGTDIASPAGMSLLVTDRQPNAIELKFEGSMPNPLLSGAPAIDWVLRVLVTDDNGTYRYRFSGDHDGFLAYEV